MLRKYSPISRLLIQQTVYKRLHLSYMWPKNKIIFVRDLKYKESNRINTFVLIISDSHMI